jgi:formamidopyrimidine-DNA glycosylase
MPELPEVETIARGLATAAGAEILRVEIARRDYVREARKGAARAIEGRRLARTVRHGKRLSLELAPRGRILVHLGMSGQVTLARPDDPAAPHTHLRLGLATSAGPLEIRVRDARRFGGVWIDPDGAASAPGAAPVSGPSARNGARPGPLGPDALAIDRRAFRALLRRPRQIKALLLDQHAIAGLGNIYCDEALWAAGVHPLTTATDLREDEVVSLHRHLRRILHSAIRHGGSTLRDYRDSHGAEGAYQRRHRVYGREGAPCPRCGTAIRRLAAAGRSSHVCPRCQHRRRRPSRATPCARTRRG